MVDEVVPAPVKDFPFSLLHGDVRVAASYNADTDIDYLAMLLRYV